MAVGLLEVKFGGRGSGGRSEAEGSSDSVEMPSCGLCMMILCKDGCTDRRKGVLHIVEVNLKVTQDNISASRRIERETKASNTVQRRR